MIKVILADDDFLVKDTLQGAIPWAELGMEVVGFAENGREALELCKTLQPELLVTDIRMPYLSGLEVALHLQELALPTRVVLISGVQDFNYARTALDIEAAGYILKPIQLREVTAVLRKVQNSLAMEFEREQVLRRLREKLAQDMPLARERFLHNLVTGVHYGDDELQEKMQYFRLPFGCGENVTVAVAELDDYAGLARQRSEQQLQMLNFSIADIIRQVVRNYRAGFSFSFQDNEFVILFNQEYCLDSKMNQIFDTIQELIQDFDALHMSIGVGNRAARLRGAATSYRGAKSALSHKFYTGNHAVIFLDDIRQKGPGEALLDSEANERLAHAQQMLLNQIRMGDKEKTRQLLEGYYATLAEKKSFSQEHIRSLFLELIINVNRLVAETEGEAPQMLSGYIACMQAVLGAETVEEIKAATSDMLLAISAYFDNKYNRKHNAVVEKIKAYIERTHMENVTLADIAAEVYLSTSYICAVFKRETGTTINEYIIQTKIAAAKGMLQNTTMKVLEIAENLGYESPHYFSYAFKKYTGLTPQQFRGEVGGKK